jgi:FAD/FMN-containing dehydrogenase
MDHKQKIKRISSFLATRESKEPISLKKRSVSHEVPKKGDKKFTDEHLDIGDLNEILEIDVENQTCIAEPGVTFIDLVKATLPHGLVPIVVPELKTITIGGAVAGCSIESMSYKKGGFHDNCLEYEVITAKGDVITCSPEKDGLLFQMMHGTFGTLGIISKLKFKLIPAKKFVKVTYEKYSTLDDYKDAIYGYFKRKDADFMDGIIHSPTEYVLSIGNFVDSAPYTNKYDWMKIYYLSTKKRKEDYLKTIDYFFRYDKGVTNVNPKSFIGRLLFGKFMNSSNVLRFANRFHKIIPADKFPITVDTFIPFSKMNEFMAWYEEKVGHFPLWVVPYKIVRVYEWVSPDLNVTDELFLDIAIYGMKPKKGVNYYKLIEDELYKIGGIKTLISQNYYTEEGFWKSWNKENYYAVKKRTDPDNIFRDLYTKTCRAAMGK